MKENHWYSAGTDLRMFCRNTIVCDTEREAKELAFGSRGERHKVVTKGGLLIAKTGAMTGGGGGNLEAKAAQLNQAQFQQLKQVHQTLVTFQEWKRVASVILLQPCHWRTRQTISA